LRNVSFGDSEEMLHSNLISWGYPLTKKKLKKMIRLRIFSETLSVYEIAEIENYETQIISHSALPPRKDLIDNLNVTGSIISRIEGVLLHPW
jgi:hypothetical protein